MSPLPTAVVAANDLVAVGAMGVFESRGLRVPDDISVVGYDDSQIARLDLVQLTSVCQGVDQFGVGGDRSSWSTASRTRTGRGRCERIETTLVERRTTAPAGSVEGEGGPEALQRLIVVTRREGLQPDHAGVARRPPAPAPPPGS